MDFKLLSRNAYCAWVAPAGCGIAAPSSTPTTASPGPSPPQKSSSPSLASTASSSSSARRISTTPSTPPPSCYPMDPNCVVECVTHERTQGRAPPYIIYVDHATQEIIMAIRGLNLVKESD
ncbi:hypothetical protein AAC387_Pa11g2198 [Persea americana]